MSSGRKSIAVILLESSLQNNPDPHDFLNPERGRRKAARAATRCCDGRPSCAVSRRPGRHLSAAELTAAGRGAARSASGTWALVLVAEDQPPFLEVIGRHL